MRRIESNEICVNCNEMVIDKDVDPHGDNIMEFFYCKHDKCINKNVKE